MIGCDARMNYLTNKYKRRLYNYLNESEDRLQPLEDDFNLIWGQKKNEPHYYTIPTGQKPVKVVFDSIGIYDLSNESIDECICESLL